MSMISPADQEKLRQDFAAMTRSVSLVFFSQTFGCESCPQTRRILEELVAVSDRIAIEEVNLVLEPERAKQYGIDRAPAIVVLGIDEAGVPQDLGLRFLGTPSGYEFISLVHAVLLAGGRRLSLSEESLHRLAAVDKPMTVRVFTTPTCSYCPRAVMLAQEMAAANTHITTYAVEATEFPDLARRYRVTGVPKTVVNESVEILGAVPEEELLQAITNSELRIGNS